VSKCLTHPDTTLICPKCIAREGGLKTAATYTRDQKAQWGKLGGRPRKLKPKPD
jgi:hypothetical protein